MPSMSKYSFTVITLIFSNIFMEIKRMAQKILTLHNKCFQKIITSLCQVMEASLI